MPVGVELRDEALENVRHVAGGDLEVPLQPAGHRGAGHVRGVDVGGRESGGEAQVVQLLVDPEGRDVGHAAPFMDRAVGCRSAESLSESPTSMSRYSTIKRFLSHGRIREGGLYYHQLVWLKGHSQSSYPLVR